MSDVQVVIPSVDELTDNADRLLQQGLMEAAAAAGIDPTAAPDIALARANTKVLSFAMAVGLAGNYQYDRDVIAPNAIPTKARGNALDMWLDAYGLPRKLEKMATGAFIGTGTPGAKLDQGANISVTTLSDKQTYTSTESIVVAADGTFTVSVVCDTTGYAGNQDAGTVGTLTATADGINSAVIVAAPGLAGGADREKDTEAVYRLSQRLANPPRGSAPSDYERWALSVTGITRAWGVRNPAGPTSAGVMIMADNNRPYGLPTAAQKAAVVAYISDPKRSPPDELFVIVPEPVFVDVRLQVSPDTPAVRDAVELELRDLFYREAVPGGRIEHTHLSEAVSIAAGEYTHIFESPELQPGGYLSCSTYQLLILRSVVFV